VSFRSTPGLLLQYYFLNFFQTGGGGISLQTRVRNVTHSRIDYLIVSYNL
jgi:hypothetical protein